MTNAKIEFSFGSLSFAGEGTEQWLGAQLQKVIDAAPKLSSIKVPTGPEPEVTPAPEIVEQEHKFTDSLASYIKAKSGDSNQVKRFLATADWLRRRGAGELKTAAVSKALSDNHQKKLGNPSDCLNKLVSQGLCEKKGGGFFITPDGLNSLGHR